MILIDTPEKLRQESCHWKGELGIDIECENNLHHYGIRIALIQISEGRDWIVDAISVRDLGRVRKFLENPGVLKVFHDVSFDLRVLHHELSCRPRNIFDTQLAAEFLGKAELGLGALLGEYFGIAKKSRFQMADWTKRPLTRDMLEYAALDARYLVELKNRLCSELRSKGLLAWTLEEMKALESQGLTLREPGFFEMKGLKALSPRARGSACELYSLRRELAKKVNRPVHFIMNNKRLLESAAGEPDWRTVKGVHPVVRQYASAFHFAHVRGSKNPIILPEKKPKRLSARQQQLFRRLTDARERASEKTGLKKHLIMSKEQLICEAQGQDALRPWQRKIIKENM